MRCNSLSSATNRHHGFTLVELLVVIAIIGILVALLLPAVQSAREAARRMTCGNNLKQIGVALHGYELTNKCYPPGSFWNYNGNSHYTNYRGSILIRFLPFIEQQAVYDMFDLSLTSRVAVDKQTISNSSGKLIQSIEIPVYICPSDDHPRLLDGKALHNYAASIGPTTHANNEKCPCPEWDSWNDYARFPGGGTYAHPFNFAGPFFRIQFLDNQTRITDCTDGLSSTIFFGEVRPMCSAHNGNGWGSSNNGQGLTSTIVPINYDSCKRDYYGPENRCGWYCNWNTELSFKSRHPGGAQFLFGDGAVHFIDETIDHWTYQYLGAKADERVVAVP